MAKLMLLATQGDYAYRQAPPLRQLSQREVGLNSAL